MFKQEFTGGGSHRIVQVDRKGQIVNRGEWVGYNNYASLNAAGKSAICVTDYFKGGPLEPGQIYFVEAQ